ncbi:MAG: hypothetical protein OWT28_03220 [Firmicutes bacterium]|nr:hypothetical protein [Bacillota bacterium]
MAILALLTFLTVAFLWLRGKYLASPLGEFASQSQRERLHYAAEFLQKKGYRIVQERVAHEMSTYFGSRKFTNYIVADFVVEKDGMPYPARVRSTRDPDRVSGVWLRRQLFPLYLSYESPVVYVCPDAGTIEVVDFSIDYPARYHRRRWRSRLLWLAIGIATGWLLSMQK